MTRFRWGVVVFGGPLVGPALGRLGISKNGRVPQHWGRWNCDNRNRSGAGRGNRSIPTRFCDKRNWFGASGDVGVGSRECIYCTSDVPLLETIRCLHMPSLVSKIATPRPKSRLRGVDWWCQPNTQFSATDGGAPLMPTFTILTSFPGAPYTSLTRCSICSSASSIWRWSRSMLKLSWSPVVFVLLLHSYDRGTVMKMVPVLYPNSKPGSILRLGRCAARTDSWSQRSFSFTPA